MTDQELFDKVVTHMLSQGVRCGKNYHFDDMAKFECLYRHDGKRCAAGALIEERYYYPALEGDDVHHELVTEALLKSGVDKKQIDLVAALQNVHDDPNAAAFIDRTESTLMTRWLEGLKRVAAKNLLDDALVVEPG